MAITKTDKPIKQIQLPGDTTVYDIAAVYDGSGEKIEEKYLQLSGGTLIGNLAITNAAMELSGRYYGTGDDEGLIIKPANNGYAGVCLGTHNGIRSVFYLNSSNQALWRYSPEGTTSYDVFHPGKAGTIALTNDLNLSTTSTGSGSIVTGIEVSGLGITVTKSTLSDLGLNTVYKYKGTKTWAELKQITSAQVGDVYSISTEDPEGNTNADWACYRTVTAATNDSNYMTYWQSLGGKVNLSNYAVLDAGNIFDGEQRMANTSYCPTMYDIASGVGCSLKNTRALDNQVIIGELLLPYTTAPGDGTANTCSVTAGEMGIYTIGGVSGGKITSKTIVGKFTKDGWIGNASSLYDSVSAGKLKWDGDHMLYAENRSGSKLHFGTDALYRHISAGYLKLLDAGNYNSYSPKLDGTGATGDWAINITGNANTATTASSVAWTNVSGKSTATQSASGLMSANDKKKLDGIATSANNYDLPTASSSTLGGVKAAAVRTTTPDKTIGKTTAYRYYGVELDKNGVMFVNVPWTDGYPTLAGTQRAEYTGERPLLASKTSSPSSNNLAFYGDNALLFTKDGVTVNLDTGQIKAASFNASSDIRLKENLMSFTPKKSILDLPIYKYDFITGAKNQIGCVAQDLQKICPEIVDEDSNGYLSIQESKIVYLLIDEIKKLKEEIKELRGE